LTIFFPFSYKLTLCAIADELYLNNLNCFLPNWFFSGLFTYWDIIAIWDITINRGTTSASETGNRSIVVNVVKQSRPKEV